MSGLSFGFPRQRLERGERRDFLPGIVRAVAAAGSTVVVERGLGSAMGYRDSDYTSVSAQVRTGDQAEAFGCDVVVVLRCPDAALALMRPGAVLVSMLHYPTRPARVSRLLELGIAGISLDSIVDDEGRRLVENLRAVAWYGLDSAFDVLGRTCPWLTDAVRPPTRVTVMGAGAVGKHAVEAATKYGSLERDRMFTAMALPGVEVTVVGRNATAHAAPMRRLLRRTDILVDATQRSDPSRPVIPNEWIADLPGHTVVCDLVVDPYLLDAEPVTVRGVEGIPAGDLDQWTFRPDDPRWDDTVPAAIPSRHRRPVVSCRAWPGLRPEPCMRHYERQLLPLLQTLAARGGAAGLQAGGGPLDRALRRAELGTWLEAAPAGTENPAGPDGLVTARR